MNCFGFIFSQWANFFSNQKPVNQELEISLKISLKYICVKDGVGVGGVGDWINCEHPRPLDYPTSWDMSCAKDSLCCQNFHFFQSFIIMFSVDLFFSMNYFWSCIIPLGDRSCCFESWISSRHCPHICWPMTEGVEKENCGQKLCGQGHVNSWVGLILIILHFCFEKCHWQVYYWMRSMY